MNPTTANQSCKAPPLTADSALDGFSLTAPEYAFTFRSPYHLHRYRFKAASASTVQFPTSRKTEIPIGLCRYSFPSLPFAASMTSMAHFAMTAVDSNAAACGYDSGTRCVRPYGRNVEAAERPRSSRSLVLLSIVTVFPWAQAAISCLGGHRMYPQRNT